MVESLRVMMRNFKREAESALGVGVAYLEFDGERATRQVENYGDRWFCSDRDFHAGLTPPPTVKEAARCRAHLLLDRKAGARIKRCRGKRGKVAHH